MRIQRQPKRVMVPCVNTTTLQSWSHWHPTMLSISLIVFTTPRPYPSPPLWGTLLPYARYHSFQPHMGECRYAEDVPCILTALPQGCPIVTMKLWKCIYSSTSCIDEKSLQHKILALGLCWGACSQGQHQAVPSTCLQVQQLNKSGSFHRKKSIKL